MSRPNVQLPWSRQQEHMLCHLNVGTPGSKSTIGQHCRQISGTEEEKVARPQCGWEKQIFCLISWFFVCLLE